LRSGEGFTLVEVMAALSVFAIITLGVIPLMLSAIRGSAVSRSFTVGKNVALEAMERARGLPYFVDYPTQKGYVTTSGSVRKVDLLDMYFPSYEPSGTYITPCPSSGLPNPACPRTLPAGYSVEFRARFVTPKKVTTAGITKETYDLKTPNTNYKWNPEPYANEDAAPADLLELTVQSSWTFGGEVRDFEVTSIIGDRAFKATTVRGKGTVDFAIQVATHYTAADGTKTQLNALGGMSESRIVTRTASVADQSVQSADIRLLTVPPDPSQTATEVAAIDGAESFGHAPPDAIPAADAQLPEAMDTTAGIDATETEDLKVSVSQELPTATGSFFYPVSGGSERHFWVNGQAGPDNLTGLQLDNSQDLVSFRPRANESLSGGTAATTTPVATLSRRVETTATVGFGRLRILKALGATGINGTVPNSGSTITSEQAVVVIDDFTASVSCKSTAATSGGNAALATKSWSAKLYYWADKKPENNIPDGEYQEVLLSSSAGTDPLSGIGPSNNPLVYDGPTPVQDVYLFKDGSKAGYLQSWSSLVGQTTNVNATGRVTQASIDGAVRIVTAPTNTLESDSSISVTLGKLSCEATDHR
jgi:prepilin-type N-terminal cleavage/methylation domain-containing protein